MATSIKLSKITRVELRSCWQNEASDFTPMLASEENIALSADALGMNEIFQRIEEPSRNHPDAVGIVNNILKSN